MKSYWFTLFFAGLFAGLFACIKSDPTAKIREAEAAYSAAETLENSDRLIAALTDFIKKNDDDRAACFQNLTRIGVVSMKNRDPRKVVASAGDAISKFGEGQNQTVVVELLAEVWHQKFTKNSDALKLEADDERRLKVLLLNNEKWLDSAMTRAEASIMVDSSATIDKTACSKFIRMAECAAFHSKNPEKTAEYLLAAGEKAMAAEQFQKAIALFERVETEFSNQKQAATALFLKGFVFENHLSDLEKARAAYQLFLKKYPRDEMAESARMSLSYLGKTEEELIREFEKKFSN